MNRRSRARGPRPPRWPSRFLAGGSPGVPVWLRRLAERLAGLLESGVDVFAGAKPDLVVRGQQAAWMYAVLRREVVSGVAAARAGVRSEDVGCPRYTVVFSRGRNIREGNLGLFESF